MEKSKTILRNAFKQAELLDRRKSCKQASIFTAVFMVVGASLDSVVYPDSFGQFFLIRVAVASVLFLLGSLIIEVNSKLMIRVTIHLMVLLPVVAISCIITLTEGAVSPYYAGINLVLMGSTLLIRWSAFDSAVSGILCVLCYACAVVAHGSEWHMAFIRSYFVFVTASMACAGTYFVNVSRFREFRLKKEVEEFNAKLQESYSQLKAMDDTKSRFFANISHELKTPLTLILGPTEDLRATATESKDALFFENLDTIEDNAFRLLRLINDILDLVKLDSNESPPRPETVDVTDFISGLTSNLRAIAELKNIKISYSSNTSKQKLVWLDRDRLEKIVLNLAVNAVKFTPSGGTITLGADTTKRELVLTVKDSGQGMSKKELENIFVRFWQADMSSKRRHRGAGIGLALVQSLTESMDGNIKVESEIDVGSSFMVTIPAPKPPAGAPESYKAGPRDVIEAFNERARMTGATRFKDEIVNESELAPFPIEGAKSTFKGIKKRVLVADDEDAMRHFISRQLHEYEVISARDGAEAWEIVQNEQLDIIVLDLMMPELDGIEVTSLIREHSEYARVPIILVTAQASDAPRLRALEAGVNDFIAKPFSSVELKARLQNLLASREFEAGLAESNSNLEVAYGKLKDQETILVQTEKLSSLGRMSAGIVHEVNNPLNYSKAALHALKTFDRQLPEAEREDFLDVLDDAQEGVNRVIGIVSDLRAFTRGDNAAMSTVILRDTIENARRLMSQTTSKISVEIDMDMGLELTGNDGQLCQLFMNLFQNAARAIQVSGKPKEEGLISVRAEPNPEGGVTAIITDNGCGISEDDIEQMFEPFFTKNDVGEGMGLGLSICHRIIQQHGASLRVNSEVGEYTEMIISFPPK